MEISVLLVLVWESRENRRMSYTHIAAVLRTRMKCEKVDNPGEFFYSLNMPQDVPQKFTLPVS